MGGGGEHGGRELPLCRHLHIVVRAVLPEVVEVLLIVRVPKVCSPCMPYRELVESQHVRHWHLHTPTLPPQLYHPIQ
jgi:hypothetical protein